jgi:sensor domain CHASE-containing protein
MFNKRNLIISAVVVVVSTVAYLFFKKDIQEILRVRKAAKRAKIVEESVEN